MKKFCCLFFYLFLFQGSAHSQVTNWEDYDEIWRGIDEAINSVSDRTVLDSIDSEINPKIAEVCGLVEDGKIELLRAVFDVKNHPFLEKSQKNTYYSISETLTKFSCKRRVFDELAPHQTTTQYSLLELSILNSRNGKIRIFDELMTRVNSLTKENQIIVLERKNENEKTALSFVKSVQYRYKNDFLLAGVVLDENDIVFEHLDGMGRILEKQMMEANK